MALSRLPESKLAFNEAYLIDSATRDCTWIERTQSAETIIKPYLRGQDIGRWMLG